MVKVQTARQFYCTKFAESKLPATGAFLLTSTASQRGGRGRDAVGRHLEKNAKKRKMASLEKATASREKMNLKLCKINVYKNGVPLSHVPLKIYNLYFYLFIYIFLCIHYRGRDAVKKRDAV